MCGVCRRRRRRRRRRLRLRLRLRLCRRATPPCLAYIPRVSTVNVRIDSNSRDVSTPSRRYESSFYYLSHCCNSRRRFFPANVHALASRKFVTVNRPTDRPTDREEMMTTIVPRHGRDVVVDCIYFTYTYIYIYILIYHNSKNRKSQYHRIIDIFPLERVRVLHSGFSFFFTRTTHARSLSLSSRLALFHRMHTYGLRLGCSTELPATRRAI